MSCKYCGLKYKIPEKAEDDGSVAKFWVVKMEQGECLGIIGNNFPLARKLMVCTEFSATTHCPLSFAVFERGEVTWES